MDLLIAGSPCFPEGALVLREDGFVPIEQIEIGDMVVTHKGRLRRVLNIGSKIADTVMVKGQGSVGIECTSNHPFYSVSKRSVWNNSLHLYENVISDPEWIEAGNMKGRFWFNVSNIEPIEIPQFKSANPGLRGGGFIENFNMTKDFFYFVGRWLGDGWTNVHLRKGRKDSKMKRVYVCCSPNESDFLKSRLSLTGLHFTESNNGSTIRFTCSSTQLYDWLVENFGSYAHGKNIPSWCLGMDRDFREAMFNGYIDADGNLHGNHIRSTSINRALSVGMKLLSGSIGRTSSVYISRPARDCIIEGRHVNENPSFQQSYYTQSRSAFFHDRGWYGLVRNVVECRKNVRVYNIEVEEDHSYTVDGIAVHNCQGFSQSGKKLNFDDPRSKLFFEVVRAIDEVKPKYFMLENVPMRKEYEDTITSYLGVDPVEINSSLVSAQNRKRLYWVGKRNEDGTYSRVNIPLPEDKGILLENVVLPDVLVDRDKSHAIISSIGRTTHREYFKKNQGQMVYDAIELSNIYGGFGEKKPRVHVKKSVTIRVGQGSGHIPSLVIGDKAREFTIEKLRECIRKVTPLECERLQTLPDNYTKFGKMSNEVVTISDTQRYKCIGNGWTTDVIAHIFSFLRQ